MVKKKSDDTEEKILDVDASMQGTITFKDPVNLRINGSFEGKLITRGNLTIGENAKVKAGIQGDRIIVAGKVDGDINAAVSLSVIAPAVIHGNIVTPRLSVTEGAVMEGQLSMMNAGPQGGSEDVLLTLKDVSQYLEVETGVVEEWAKKQRIPARFENGEWVFSKSSIDRWIQEENIRV
ncbi:MAG: polymer-forming cytoskeletal protein [Candidatus Omnitrophica bacterium]|nr:polymer-forming cytoskeletal protein [Candidatus Omnitrophota bacterium]MDD5671208.1 polymer-forming cytoskeletal protein [Candidatus Omnitrophota bacterium]